MVTLLAHAGRRTARESGIDTVDPIVAAVADIYDEPALTANVEHVSDIGGTAESY